MVYTHYTPLSTPTRLAAGLGLKEIPYPNGIRPCDGSPASHNRELSICNIFFRIILSQLLADRQFPEENHGSHHLMACSIY